MAGHAGRRRAGGIGPRVADAHRAYPATRRTLRHPAAAAHRRSRHPRRPRGRTPQEDGGGMEVKPGYKRTEAGVIPEEWEVTSLEQVSDPKRSICYGIVQVGPFSNGGISVLAIKNLN